MEQYEAGIILTAAHVVVIKVCMQTAVLDGFLHDWMSSIRGRCKVVGYVLFAVGAYVSDI